MPNGCWKRAYEVSVLEFRVLDTAPGPQDFLAVDGLGIHRDEGGKPVSAVDVKRLGHRSESVGRIEVSPVGGIELKAPVLPILVPIEIEIVVI